MIIDWNDDAFLLGLEIMDDTHKQFVRLVNELWKADDTIFPSLFNQLITHTQLHFMEEDKLMEVNNFSAVAEHQGEHQRILGELNYFKKRVDKGLITFSRNYIKGRLPEWFSLHSATMDSALAMHVKTTIAG